MKNLYSILFALVVVCGQTQAADKPNVIFILAEGKTGSQAVDAPWGFTGDRHHSITLPDGPAVHPIGSTDNISKSPRSL